MESLTVSTGSTQDAMRRFTGKRLDKDLTYLSNVSCCFVIKETASHLMIKLPTKEVIFYPKKMIKDVKAEKLDICFKEGLEFKANKARQENGQWIRYDHRVIPSSELIEIILNADPKAIKC